MSINYESLLGLSNIAADFINVSQLTATNANITNNISIGGNETITGNANISGNETINGTLTVKGDTTMGDGSSSSNGQLIIQGSNSTGYGLTMAYSGIQISCVDNFINPQPTFALQVGLTPIAGNCDANIVGSLTVGGNTHSGFSGLKVNTNTNLGLNSTHVVTVTGSQTISSTLSVTGNTSLSTLSTSGLATLNSLVVTNNESVGGTLTVTGQTLLNSSGVSLQVADSVLIGGDISIYQSIRSHGPGTALVVDSDTNLNTLTCFGDVTLNGSGTSLTVGNDTLIGRDLTVSGATTLNGLAGLTVANTGFFGGTVQINGVSGAGISLTLNGGASVGGLLGVVGNTILGGTLGVTGISFLTSAQLTSTLVVAGTTTLNNTLTVAQGTTLNGSGTGLTVTNNTSLGGTLTVTGDTTLNGTGTGLTVAHNTSIGGTLIVSGDVTLNGGSVGLTVANSTSLNGLTVASSAAFNGGTGGGAPGITVANDILIGGEFHANVGHISTTLRVSSDTTLAGVINLITAGGNGVLQSVASTNCSLILPFTNGGVGNLLTTDGNNPAQLSFTGPNIVNFTNTGTVVKNIDDSTGMTASITPTNTSAKILIMISGAFGINTGMATLRILKNSFTVLAVIASTSLADVPISYTYLDSPATTSSVNYEIDFTTGGDIVTWNTNGNTCSLILQECR